MSSDAYAKLFFSIWRDRDFKALSPDAQYVYLMALSSPDRSKIGRLPWTPAHLAANSDHESLTSGRVVEALQELHRRNYVLVDESSQEMLIRALVRRDDLVRMPNFGATVAKLSADLISPVLYQALVEELSRIYADFPPEVLRAEKARKKQKPGPKRAGAQTVPDTFWEKLGATDRALHALVVSQARKETGKDVERHARATESSRGEESQHEHMEPYTHYDPDTGEIFDGIIAEEYTERSGHPVDNPVDVPVDNAPPY